MGRTICSVCGVFSRACSDTDSKSEELREVAVCPNASESQRRAAQDELMEKWGWRR